MVNISNELKEKYRDDGSHHVDYQIRFFPSIKMLEEECFLTVTNDDLVYESVRLVEGIWGEDTFTYSSIVSSEFSFDVADITTDMQGAYIEVIQYLDGDIESKMPMGKYIVTSVKKQKDKRIKNVTAYDYMHLAKVSGIELYYKIISSIGSETNTWGDICQQIADYIGVEIDLTSLGEMATSYKYINMNKANTGGSFTVWRLIADIGAILGGWFRFDRYGVLKLYRVGMPVSMETFEYGVNFELGDSNFVPIDNVHYDTAYGTFYEHNVDTNPNGINSVRLNGNMFMTAGSDADIFEQLKIIYGHIKDITFSPATAEVEARPYLEVGDYYSFYENGVLKTSLIAERTLSGIQAQRDVFTVSAGIIVNNDYDSAQSQITSNTSTAAATASKLRMNDDLYVSEIRKVSEAQISITIKSISDETVSITNVYNITQTETGERWTNSVNNTFFDVVGW